MFEFQEWPKIPRYKRTVFLTEKINGSNAQVAVFEINVAQFPALLEVAQANKPVSVLVGGAPDLVSVIFAGSRNRWLQPEGVGPKGCDNFGFAAWVRDNAQELVKLGPGRHYGEWWGQGIQCGYGLKEKRFSLFNTARWGAHNPPPACCHIVPLLYQGTPDRIDEVLENLRKLGSSAAPGFMKPEGVIVYHADSRQYYKITLDNDDVPKSKTQTVVQSGNVVGGDLAAGDIVRVLTTKLDLSGLDLSNDPAEPYTGRTIPYDGWYPL